MWPCGLIGQMTTGFPVSPLTPRVLLVGLAVWISRITSDDRSQLYAISLVMAAAAAHGRDSLVGKVSFVMWILISIEL